MHAKTGVEGGEGEIEMHLHDLQLLYAVASRGGSRIMRSPAKRERKGESATCARLAASEEMTEPFNLPLRLKKGENGR